MDDGEIEVSENILVPNSDPYSNIQASMPVDSFLDELLSSSQTCTHTHTCNPPGPDAAAHIHTCYHTHTQVIQSEKLDVQSDCKNSTSESRRPSGGNREAVRKYREKKKAHTAYLEEEVKKLRFVNQQLVRKVQRQAILEAEVLRLKGLLLDLRGKIDNELESFPFPKECNFSTSTREGDCGIQYSGGQTGLQCENDLACHHPQSGSSVPASEERYCPIAVTDCQDHANARGIAKNCGHSLETMVSSVAPQADE